MSLTQVMSEILMFFKVFKGLKTLKNMSFSVITWVIDIAQKAYSTLMKALYNGNFSLENIQKSKSYSKDHKNAIEFGRVVPKKQTFKHIPVLLALQL